MQTAQDDEATQWKIALPRPAVNPVLKWYHQILGHPGENRLRATVQARYHHPEMRRFCKDFACDACQRHKLDGPGYGLLPERDVDAVPFNEVAVDLIGPWKITVQGQEVVFNVLTSIDPVSLL